MISLVASLHIKSRRMQVSYPGVRTVSTMTTLNPPFLTNPETTFFLKSPLRYAIFVQ